MPRAFHFAIFPAFNYDGGGGFFFVSWVALAALELAVWTGLEHTRDPPTSSS